MTEHVEETNGENVPHSEPSIPTETKDTKDTIADKIDNKPSLKVAADKPDISPEDRKRNVKKLAGAISHSLRTGGEINVRAFGNACIGKSTKALAIAKSYIADTHNLQLAYSPAFLTAKIGDSTLTGMCFCTFCQPKEREVDLDKVKSVLMVKADPKDIDPEERRIKVRKLAGAITHAVEENKECVVRCFGNASIGKGCKALAIARGFTATRGPDLYCWDDFIVANMGGNERTGIAFYAFTNET